MIRIVSPRRTQYTNLIHQLPRQRQQTADRDTTAATRTKPKRLRQQARRPAPGPEIRFRGTLAGILLQQRLRIKEIPLIRTAIHKQMNHPPSTRCKMLQAGFTRVRQRRRQTNTASTSTQSMNQTTTSQNSSGIQLQITESTGL